MRVRVPNLLGNDVHQASFVSVPDELGDDGATKRILRVAPAGKDVMDMESYSADELVIVEASAEEEAELAELGWGDAQREA